MPIAHFERRAINSEPLCPTLNRYLTDPAFKAQHDAETQAWRDRANASIDAAMLRVKGGRTDD